MTIIYDRMRLTAAEFEAKVYEQIADRHYAELTGMKRSHIKAASAEFYEALKATHL